MSLVYYYVFFSALLFAGLFEAVSARQCNTGASTSNQPYTTRSCYNGQNYCATWNQYDQSNNLLKVTRDCADSTVCSSNTCYDNTDTYTNYHTRICCCDKDYCNSAPRSLLVAIPAAVAAFYYYIKSC